MDGIAAHWDFPSSALAGVQRNAHGLSGPGNEAICRCEHKCWSRLEQSRAAPDLVPPFAVFGPFAEDPVSQIGIDCPFWAKPVKAHSSHLGFRIGSPDDLRGHLPEIREKIGLFGEPFDQHLRHVDLPEKVAGIGGRWRIAEGITLAGRQCTLEGYVRDGPTVIYGVVVSVRSGRRRSSFSRYPYPSRLPERARAHGGGGGRGDGALRL